MKEKLEKMESENGLCRRGCRQMSPVDGARMYVHKQPKVVARASRRVQVVYYLTRNGQLEHPHYMELSLLPNQHLRLRDVMDRLIALRGKGMPSLYSWSSKRTYKNGYVWNDLLENDIIFPTDGAAEYVLKGSELIEGCAATDGFQQHHVMSNNMQRKPMLTPPRSRRPEEVEEDEDYEEYEEKTSYTSSKGVSTEEIEETHKNLAELTLDSDSPPPPPSSCTTSDKTRKEDGGDGQFKRNDSDNNDQVVLIPSTTATTSQVIPSRNSVLLQLIACGGSTSVTKAKTLKQVGVSKKSDSGLHKGVLCKTAAAKMEEEDMIRYMSENPRFGNMQSEEKEYFSGSIVESMSSDQRVETQPVLKRSNSYNNEQERCLKIGLEETEDEEEKREKALKGKCIPRMKPSCAKQIKNGLN